MTLEILISQTAGSNVWSFNTQKFTENAYLEQIIVVAATDTTTFDFYIQDPKSVLIFDTRTTDGPDATGTLRRNNLRIPMIGIHTVGVANSSANEAYTGKLVYSERVL